VLARRIIPCLDVHEGRVVKGVNFVNLVDAGDPVEAAVAYDRSGADELVFLDITATHENRPLVLEMVRQVAERVFMPFTVGGGVRSLEDARALLLAGADKVSVNSAAVARPELIRELSEHFGSQAVVLAIDANRAGQVGGLRCRRPQTYRPRRGRMGPRGRKARGGRDLADQHGRRWHQGWL